MESALINYPYQHLISMKNCECSLRSFALLLTVDRPTRLCMLYFGASEWEPDQSYKKNLQILPWRLRSFNHYYLWCNKKEWPKVNMFSSIHLEIGRSNATCILSRRTFHQHQCQHQVQHQVYSVDSVMTYSSLSKSLYYSYVYLLRLWCS